MIRKSHAATLVLLLTLFLSCKKEKLNLVFEEINTPTNCNLNNLFVLNDSVVFACGGQTGNGVILRSSDGGQSWQLLHDQFDYNIHSLFFLDYQNGFCGGDSTHVYQTNDGGISWQMHFDWEGIPFQYSSPLRSVCFVNKDTGFFAGGKNFDRGIIYSTTDGGEHWNVSGFEHELRCITPTAAGILSGGYGTMLLSKQNTAFETLNCDRSFYTGIAFSNTTDGVACSYNGALYHTDNGGNTFSLADKKNQTFGKSEHFLCIDARKNKIISSGLGGFTAVSTDGGENYDSGYSLNNSRINSVKFLNDTIAIASADFGKIFRIHISD
jgi:photosystem II stability/assembly factor-like uncharacterized protein